MAMTEKGTQRTSWSEALGGEGGSCLGFARWGGGPQQPMHAEGEASLIEATHKV